MPEIEKPFYESASPMTTGVTGSTPVTSFESSEFWNSLTTQGQEPPAQEKMDVADPPD